MPLLPMKKIWTPLELFGLCFFKDRYYGEWYVKVGKRQLRKLINSSSQDLEQEQNT